MKDFSNEQKIVFITSIISVLLLIYQVVSIKIDTKEITVNNNRSKIKNIKKLEASLTTFNYFTFLGNKDLFFYKKKTIVKKAVVKKVVIKKGKTIWRFKEIKPYTSEKLRMLMYSDGSVTVRVKGKTHKYKLGNKISVGIKIQKEVMKSTGKSTGEIREGSEYLGKILYFNARTMYIGLPLKKALLIGLRGKTKIVPRSKVPRIDNSEDDDNSDSHFRGRGRG